jgi:sortase A
LPQGKDSPSPAAFSETLWRHRTVKKKLPIIAIGCVLLLGVCVMLYPVVSSFLSKMAQSATISNYRRAVENLSDKEIEKLKAEAVKYNESLSGTVPSDPFADERDSETSNFKLLETGEVIGYIEIPKIDVYLPIYHGTTEEILQKGVGHLKNTSLPIGGKSTHAVLSAHRGLPSATLFTNLDQLEKNDVFYIHILDEVLAYKVDQIKVVDPENIADLMIQNGKDFVTLITCTPYGINTQRLLVRGERTEYAAPEKQAQPVLALPDEVNVVPPVFLILVFFPIVLLVWKKRGAGK